jgi:protein tyrosine/serine phosphatase
MPDLITREHYATRLGRVRAWISLFLGDHGFLRACYDNSHAITEKMWRTYQPSPRKIEEWADRGIKTVINLRGKRIGDKQDGLYLLEEEACEKAGINLVSFRAFSRQTPSKEFIFGMKELFDKIEYPAILHCKSGADRAGISSVLFLFLHEGKSLDEAMEQLSHRFGHIKSGKTGVLDFFFDHYVEFADKENVTPNADHFLHWVEHHYDPEDIQRRFKPGIYGNILTEFVLRRE